MFPATQKFAVIDYETFSCADLPKEGGHQYAKNKTTEVMCLSYALGTYDELLNGDYKVKTFAPKTEFATKKKWWSNKKKKEVASILLNDDIILVAHNSLFEQAITRFVLPRHLHKELGLKSKNDKLMISPSRFYCTAALAQVYALPRKLEVVCEALKLDHQKDMQGHRVMLKMSKPRKPTKNNPSIRHTDINDFLKVVKYCEKDIHAEVAIFTTLAPMIESERALWEFDQQINWRGLNVDLDLVRTIENMIREEKSELTKQLRKVTGGKVQTGGQRDEILKWLKSQGVLLPNLTKKTVDDFLKNDSIPKKVKLALTIRQSLNKTSLKKYSALLKQTDLDDFVIRFLLNFHAASTGRWGGALFQPHNLPRGNLKKKFDDGFELDLAPLAAEMIKNGASIDLVRLCFGDVLETFVSTIRCMLVPPKGREFIAADFASIEVRVLFWLADHKKGVKDFFNGAKMYEEMAKDIFDLPSIKDVSPSQRFIGKQTVLGDGYGMGWKKFQQSCADLGQVITTVLAKKAVNTYRTKNKPVCDLWNKYERAAIKAVLNPDKSYTTNYVTWSMQGKFLTCKLPSGRSLYYAYPAVSRKMTPWGQHKETLSFYGVDSRTKKWKRQFAWGGVLVENVVQAVSRDIMAESMKRVERKGYLVHLTVHDEVITSVLKGFGSVKEFEELITKLPKWAKGCPVAAEGWRGLRYRK